MTIYKNHVRSCRFSLLCFFLVAGITKPVCKRILRHFLSVASRLPKMSKIVSASRTSKNMSAELESEDLHAPIREDYDNVVI